MTGLHLGARIDPASGERLDRAADGTAAADDTGSVRLRSEELTTHGVIVGMTGSGKTGLGVVLIEEVLRAGLPVLAIDPKGDLTNLCLMFPDLAADDFRPWIDEAQARTAGQEPDEFAARQATAWRDGLAGWGLGGTDIAELRERVSVAVYTPGSQAGTPIDLVGALDAPVGADDETVAAEIEGYVSGLLGLVGIAADPLSSREHILLANLIAHWWSQARSLDLATLVGAVQQPPIRKLGVFELDQFFPPKDRTALAMKLNGLLASPSFASWAMGERLDIDALLRSPDGRPRCAVITTAHLSDDERQFVTSLVLSKLVTWMRRQSGTTDLRALLYMDEVHGYLPPVANPPTKQPIMTLMKTARAFGVGVVLSTQNPVDVDYKAISNAGTWMIGRLQTERDKARLLDGMSAASGGVDVGGLSDTIAGLGKRQFVLRRASAHEPVVFTTRWAMSYLRGPMTRDQIARLERPPGATTATADPAPGAYGADGADGAGSSPSRSESPTPAPAAARDDETSVMPEVARDVPVRWVDPAAPWLADVGGDHAGHRFEAGIAARVHLRYKQAKADLDHDEEYEAVLFPLPGHVDARHAVAVDYDDRDLRADAPAGAVYVLPEAPIATSTLFTQVKRDLIEHVQRNLRLELPAHPGLKLYGRADETAAEFAARCRRAADARADAEIAKRRDTYEARATKLRDQIAAAEDRAAIAAEQARGQRNSELLSTAGSVLGGLLGGGRSRRSLDSILGQAGTAAGRRGRSNTSQQRADAAQNKVLRMLDDLERLEAELAGEIVEIGARWSAAAAETTTIEVTLAKTNIAVTDLTLAWVPVARAVL